MTPPIPYAQDLRDRDPIAAIRESLARIRSLGAAWTPAEFERSYAPGKWSARQILGHLAQAELAFGNRARMALAAPSQSYVAQPFDQNAWMARESALGGREALDALVSVGVMNLALYGSLTPADRGISFEHPEYGSITVDWLIHQSAGHLLHHLQQLEAAAAG